MKETPGGPEANSRSHRRSLSLSCSYYKGLSAILIAVVLLVIYGSLYPFQFQARQLFANPLSLLLHSWSADMTARRFLIDVAVNITMYVPLGLSGYLAAGRFRPRWLAIVAPVVLGVILSGSIEMLQLFTPSRQCSTFDLLNNSLGSAIGVVCGIVCLRHLGSAPVLLPFRIRDRVAGILLVCWFLYLLFPLFPVLFAAAWRVELQSFAHAPRFTPSVVLLAAAEWFAVGRLLLACGVPFPKRVLAALLLLLPAQFAIVHHNPLPSTFIGAVAGVLLFWLYGELSRAGLLSACALLLAASFSGTGTVLGWLPFGSLAAAPWQIGIPILFGKLFQYGASLWLLRLSGS